MIPLIGVLLAFMLIIVLRVKDIDFSITLISASALLGLSSGKPLSIFVDVAFRTLTDPTTFDLCAAIALITLLGYSLKETGLMTDLIGGLKELLPSRVLLSLIPALFGLLPMPGGALISAPFNEPEAERLGLKPEHKTYVNVWFRHIWYWASPVSPVPILAATLAGFTLTDFIRVQLPVFAATLAIGFIVSRAFIKNGGDKGHASKNYSNAVKGLAPIIATIVLSVAGAPIWAALTVGIIMIFFLKHVTLGKALGMMRDGVRWDIAASAVSMLFFRYMVVATGSVNSLFQSITKAGVPLLVLIIAFPLFIGFLSGTPTMGMGIVFPLLMPMYRVPSIHVVSVIYAGVIAGYLASPMHLCLILTNSYYKSELRKVYNYLVPSVAILYVAAYTYHMTMNIF